MGNLIKYEINNDNIKVVVDPIVGKIIPLNKFPMTFKVENWLNGDIIWECELFPGYWASWDDLNFKNFSVYGKDGELLKRKIFSPYMDTGDIEEFFYLWIGSREITNGLVLGAGTGLWGEWVFNVINNDCKVVLVEGDPNNTPHLSTNHENRTNVVIEPVVVSPNGGKVKFWVAPQGCVSSMNEENVKKFLPDMETEFIEVESKSIMNIIHDNFHDGLDWMRIDLEGIDHQIIMNIDDEILQQVKMIIYENMNISKVEIDEIKEKLSKNGFTTFIDFGIDTACVK